PGQRLDGRDLVRLGLHGQQQAGANRTSVEQDGAAPADPVLAADMGACEPELVTQVVAEQPPRRGGRRPLLAVDFYASDGPGLASRDSVARRAESKEGVAGGGAQWQLRDDDGRAP